jgi:eukaryotic-like serine/threonine-protein kinase
MSTAYHELRNLFEAAMELAPKDRATYLDAHCANAQVRARVERMLAIEPGPGGAIPKTSAEALAQQIGEVQVTHAFTIGSLVGPFELIDVLGQGGSSTVFRARREIDGVRQDVALKLLHRGLHTQDAQRQFRHERLALTALTHPGIAHLIEGGVTDNGLAYIALELIDGVPITDYATAAQLDIRERLTLFLKVCQAVEAAHRALIVHRDLKPNNVLVTPSGDVKLLDFGIAKLLDADDQTQTHLPAFTPAYAAPEQRSGGAMTTATDVYALGLLLGELLTGMRLNDGSRRTPSSRIDAESHVDPAAGTPDQIRRRLRGDLDNIVMKAIAGEPEHRYPWAGALADDIERYLAGRPVVAHPPSRWYRTRKFVSRHRGAAVTTCVLLLAVFAALAVAVWQASVARAEAQRANAVRKFLVEIFDAAKMQLPSNQRPTPEVLVREAARRAREDVAISPALRADLLRTLGTVSLTMGDYPQAEKLLDEALQKQAEAGIRINSPERLDALIQKGNVLLHTNRSADADTLMRDVLPALRQQNTDTFISGLLLYSTTRLFAGKIDEAAAIAREAALRAATDLPADSPDRIKVESFPGQISIVARHWPEAVAQLDPVVARWRALGIAQDIDFAQTVNNLAVAKQRMDDRVGAEALFRESIALRRRIYEGRDNDRLASALESFAIFLIRHEDFDEAQKLLDEAIAIDRRVLGEDNVALASLLDTLGTLEGGQRQFERAEDHVRTALKLYVDNVAHAGEQDNEVAIVRLHLSQILIERGTLDEAQEQENLALQALLKQNGENSDLVASTWVQAGRIALKRGDAEAAQSMSEKSLSILAAVTAPSPRAEMTAHQLRAEALAARGNHEEAIAETNLALAAAHTATPDAHSKIAALLALRARQEKAVGKSDAFAATLREAHSLQVPPQRLSPQDATTLGAGN